MRLAQQGEGRVNPNPLVGALIVKDDDVIARGWHHRYGDLHAERDAFKYAEEHGIRIINCTPGEETDIFPYCPLADLLA